MIHPEKHPLAGQTVKIADHVPEIGGQSYIIEDWWDRLIGKSWGDCDGNPACIRYAIRTGVQQNPVPMDDEVLYGKIGAYGNLVHVSELEPCPNTN